MANIKSSKKRIKVTAQKTLLNKMVKARTKTYVKKVLVAVQSNNKEEAAASLKVALKAIDKAYTKGIFHKNTAARKKSHLTKLVNAM